MFDEEFLNKLPSNPYEAAQVMCDRFIDVNNTIPSVQEAENYKMYIEAFAAMEAFINVTGLPFTVPEIKIEDSKENNIKLIISLFFAVKEGSSGKLRELTLDKAREKYTTLFGTTFIYQFSDGDLTRIQQLINELRDAITKSELFDAKHKQRILTKLEGLQSELHKKMSSLDKFWGLIGDAGVVLGKFGQDAKPLVDRIREIAQIVWRTQARAEELPSGTTLPLLTDGKQDGN
jgi:hypothetical protein